MSFNNIIGHEKINNRILRAIRLDKFPNSHIIVGEDGIGKSIIAREMAAAILGKNEIRQCTDILEYKLSKNKKSIGIDEIKSIIEETNKKPYEGNKKVVIVYNSESMTEAAQNAFLKTIEEPSNGVYIILLCEKLDNILDTIRSRCEVHKLNRLKDDEMDKFLDYKFPSLSYEDKKAVISFSDGIPGRAEKFIEDSSLHDIRNITIELLKKSQEENIQFIFKYEDFLFKHKEEWDEILTCILSYIRDVFIYKETGQKNLLINSDKFNDIKLIGEMFSFNKFNIIINIIKITRKKLKNNVNVKLVFDDMLLKMQEV